MPRDALLQVCPFPGDCDGSWRLHEANLRRLEFHLISDSPPTAGRAKQLTPLS
jgi:hypothetical protein